MTLISTCRNCEYFVRNGFEHWGSCTNTKMAKEKSNCHDGLFINDCLGEWEIEIGLDFCCIHFKEIKAP